MNEMIRLMNDNIRRGSEREIEIVQKLRKENELLRQLLKESLDAWTGEGKPINLDRIYRIKEILRP